MKFSGGVRGDFFKSLALIVGCGLAWYLGQICAVLFPPGTFSVAVSQIVEKPSINAATGKVHGSDSFNMWEGDNVGPLIKFINGIPNNSIVLMATYDEGSTKLSQEARKEIEKLGSKEIQQIGFRSSWVFVGAKGFTLPEGLKKEKMNHSNKEKNRYDGWPAEVQIEGCIPRRQ
ncbi:UNVERIFIED_CONTAM: hypothetical protein FKN15_037106 [Acipenser sinensis]